MLTRQRKRHILDVLRRDGQIIAKDLSQELGLSEDTIRRDLRELAQEGLLHRVHGGALPISPGEVAFSGRETINTAGKAAIGRMASQLVKDNQVIILDGGTTSLQVARHLPRTLQATIITHSPRIALEFVDYPGVEVVLIGGLFYKQSEVSVGAAAIETISHIRAHLFFMGVAGIHPDIGLTTGNLEEAYVKRALSDQAAQTIVLASQEKLGVASPYVIASLKDISGLIVEQSVSEDDLLPYRQFGLAVTRA